MISSEVFLRDLAETRGFQLGHPVRPQITPDGRSVVFLRGQARNATLALFETDVTTGQTRTLAIPSDLGDVTTTELSDAEKARRERLRVTASGFTSFNLSPDGSAVLVPMGDRIFVVERATGAARCLAVFPGEAVLDPRFSPDGHLVAFVRGHNLWVASVAPDGPPPRALSSGGTEDLFYGLPEFVAQEEMARHEGYWWSPDGRTLAVAQVDQRHVERFATSDPSRPERPPQLARYPRPGRDNAHVRLGLFAVDTEIPSPATLWVQWDFDRYPYLARVLWDTPHAPLALLVQARSQREVALLAVDEASGQTHALVSETDAAWVNLDRDLPRWLPDGRGLLWASERSGHRALELRSPQGILMRELVGGPQRFISLVHMSPASDSLVVLQGDALRNQIVRVSLGASAPVPLSVDYAEHSPSFSRDGSLFVDMPLSCQAWPRTTVHSGFDGARLCQLPDVAEIPPFSVNLELTSAGESRSFAAAVVRPRDFDAARTYPVVVLVYGGPHAQMVKADQRHYLLAQWVADRGALVVSIDNRGTPRRGRAWERAIKGSFGVVPLQDQVEGLQALAARYPEMDLQRVGIYGWSFGGTMAALAVLRRPDIFTVAVAGAPVVDWHDYDTHYTERYLGMPADNEAGYRASSPLSYASDLKRPLLLIHGTADDNVYAFHSLKLADALFRAGRPFDFLPLAGVTHQVAQPDLRQRLWQRIADYLFSHLTVG